MPMARRFWRMVIAEQFLEGPLLAGCCRILTYDLWLVNCLLLTVGHDEFVQVR